MSKFDEHFNKCLELNEKHNLNIDPDLLKRVMRYLGPSIYNRDSSMVATSDPKEMEYVKEQFLRGKLGLKDEKEIEELMKQVEDDLKGVKNKLRVLFYALLIMNSSIINENFID